MLLMCSMLAVLPCSLASPVDRTTLQEDRLREYLQLAIDEASDLHNVSFAVGVRTGTETVIAYSGLNGRSRAHSSNMSDISRFPMGSVTKSWTAAAVMTMHEQGKIDLDAPISIYVDPILTRLNGTTMDELWRGSDQVVNITARNLMGMRAGLQDYDDTALAAWTFSHPHDDWSPFDMMHALNKTFVCPPGTCGVYASSGFDLLGLALAHITGCKDWADYNQLAVLPPALLNSTSGRKLTSYAGVRFPVKGVCSVDPMVVHQYRMQILNATQHIGSSSKGGDTIAHEYTVRYSDIVDYSCLNGWTCGNIAAPVGMWLKV
jgi:CubicO group peptidase (beta-lactamase class C family)